MKYRKPGIMGFDVFFQEIKDGEWNVVRINATCCTERNRIFFEKKGIDFDKVYDSAIMPVTKGSP